MAALNQQTKTQEDSSVEPGRDRTPRGWDETEPPGTSGADPVTNGAGFLIYAITAAAVFATTLVNALSAAYDAARRGGVYDPRLPLFCELSSGVVIVALTPLIDFGVRGIRRHRAWYGKAGWAAATVLLFSALHIAGMVSLRKLALAAFGGSYGFSFAAGRIDLRIPQGCRDLLFDRRGVLAVRQPPRQGRATSHGSSLASLRAA